MNAEIHLGGESAFTLRSAVLIYSDGRQLFATRHDPQPSDVGAPTLGPGQLVTTAFLKELATGLGASVPAEVLPERVLVRTADVTVWWRPASRAPVFFNLARDVANAPKLRKLSGRRMWHPPLVFRAEGANLWVRALLKNERPTAGTRLMAAPYFNVSATGGVCVGSMRKPHDRSLASIDGWERAFFESEFTHQLPGTKLTAHPGGFYGMMHDATHPRTKAFVSSWLAPAGKKHGQLLRDFVTTSDRGAW